MKSILQTEKECYISGAKSVPLEKHHTMNGTAYRRKAEEDGLWVWLTPAIHRYIHETIEGHELLIMLKKRSQLAYEKTHTHEQWMRRYGKNYL